MRTVKMFLIVIMVSTAGVGCVRPAPGDSPKPAATFTPFQPLPPTQEVVTETTLAPESSDSEAVTLEPVNTEVDGGQTVIVPEIHLWIDPALPEAVREKLPAAVWQQLVDSPSQANLFLKVKELDQASIRWVYALAAPFPTVTDEIQMDQLEQAWNGRPPEIFAGKPLLVSPETLEAFKTRWGEPAPQAVEVISDSGSMIDRAWESRPSWALIPFEQIGPRWKVLRVNGQSPLEKNFDLSRYPLQIGFGLSGEEAALKNVPGGPLDGLLTLPVSNRDPEKLSVLVMTGTTALVRATAAKMENKGLEYPGVDIQDWLRNADLTHISNEVSFYAGCPNPDPYDTSMNFCSKPEYIALLDFIGADIIEMTGNHLVDWRRDAILDTFELYRQHNMQFYASGENLAEARKPLLISDHGNQLAFIGCNPAGPDSVWATDDRAGAADCDYEWMKAEIARLRSEGYLPIVTLQYREAYVMAPTADQKRDFLPLAEAGAVVVSGSQAHYPQGMDFAGDSFIHYGLGNLFFDQMDSPVVGTRREFIDRHVFYNGRYLGTELLTAMLEEFARPRPMTMDERSSLLEDAFDASGW